MGTRVTAEVHLTKMPTVHLHFIGLVRAMSFLLNPFAHPYRPVYK